MVAFNSAVTIPCHELWYKGVRAPSITLAVQEQRFAVDSWEKDVGEIISHYVIITKHHTTPQIQRQDRNMALCSPCEALPCTVLGQAPDCQVRHTEATRKAQPATILVMSMLLQNNRAVFINGNDDESQQ